MQPTLKGCRLDCHSMTGGIGGTKPNAGHRGSVLSPAARVLLSGVTKLLDESFNIKCFNPASDRGCRQLRAGLAVDYDQPSRAFGQGSPQ
jgi:hypothetical protein